MQASLWICSNQVSIYWMKRNDSKEDQEEEEKAFHMPRAVSVRNYGNPINHINKIWFLFLRNENYFWKNIKNRLKFFIKAGFPRWNTVSIKKKELNHLKRFNSWKLMPQSDFYSLILLYSDYFTFSRNSFAGLNAGMLWAGTIIVVFFDIFLAVFSALRLMIKLPNPRR